MATVLSEPEIDIDRFFGPTLLRLSPDIEITDKRLLEISALNPDLRIELTAEGELEIMPPASSGSGRRNTIISAQVFAWEKNDGTGVSFDSSTGFRLPNNAVRSPDASWVTKKQLKGLSEEDWDTYLHLCPEFVLELRSPSDRLAKAQAKMREYIKSGARLALLVDPLQKQLYIYRPGRKCEVVVEPATFDCGPLMPGFVLDLSEIWKPPK